MRNRWHTLVVGCYICEAKQYRLMRMKTQPGERISVFTRVPHATLNQIIKTCVRCYKMRVINSNVTTF